LYCAGHDDPQPPLASAHVEAGCRPQLDADLEAVDHAISYERQATVSD
jgi:hypothetical protein